MIELFLIILLTSKPDSGHVPRVWSLVLRSHANTMQTVLKDGGSKAVEQRRVKINSRTLVSTTMTDWTLFTRDWPSASGVSTTGEENKGRRGVKDH